MPKFETRYISLPSYSPYDKEGLCESITDMLNEGWTCVGISLVGVSYTAFFTRQLPPA